jgi:hypothetical protein
MGDLLGIVGSVLIFLAVIGFWSFIEWWAKHGSSDSSGPGGWSSM